MDVFIRNVPPQVGDKELKDFFQPYLQSLSITTFACHKSGAKWANLTFKSLHEARKFLATYGQGSIRKSTLRILGSTMYFSESTKPADKFTLRSLEMEAKRQREKENTPSHQGRRESTEASVKTFDFSTVSCGNWAYDETELVFNPEIIWRPAGKLTFGKRSLRALMGSGHRIDISYSGIQCLVVGAHAQQSLTITCYWAPKFSTGQDLGQDITTMLQSMGLYGQVKKKPRVRTSSLGNEHERIVPSCLVYRFELTSVSNQQLRGGKFPPEIPPVINQRTRIQSPKETFIRQFQRMTTAFSTFAVTNSFSILFQLQKLAQNGYLSPLSVIELLPEVTAMAHRSGNLVASEALRKLFNDLPFRGPEADAQEFHLHNLMELLRYGEARAKEEESYNAGPSAISQSSNTARIFRAKVTPAGVYLYGPSLETKNRVMRRYSDYLDYFLRVEFCDEDGQQIRYDPRVSNDEIFNERFKSILQEGINIAGRVYGFLGYSHSSLRAQTCWFMAPFWHEANRELVMYQKLVADLGDFSHIQSPAKCAARIGQTFSDTPITVPLGSTVVKVVHDIERNGRVFSDGVGTFSEIVLNQIWNALSSKHLVKPRIFQIRHQGKGLSLSTPFH